MKTKKNKEHIATAVIAIETEPISGIYGYRQFRNRSIFGCSHPGTPKYKQIKLFFGKISDLETQSTLF